MKLSVSKRNQLSQRIDLGKDVLAIDYSETIFLIGRSKDCHVVLDDKQVSREHVRIIHKSRRWFVEKTSKENICLFNGEEFEKAELANGDTLAISHFTLTIELLDDLVATKENTFSSAPSAAATVEIKPVASIPQSSQLQSFGSKNQDLTTEFDSSLDTSNEEPNSEVATDGEMESPSDFEAFDAPGKNDDDVEYASDLEATENAEAALGISDDSVEDNESYSLENIDNVDESTKVMESFSKVQLELFGETAPYDRYLIESVKTFIGRDPAKCQIVLNDTEVSTVHAVITKNNIMVTLEDLNSSNGTILNGDRINRATLSHNDEFVIGGVSFTVKFNSEFLQEENSRLMAVDDYQTVEVEEVVEVEAEIGEQLDALGGIVSEAEPEKSIIKRIWKDEQKRKKAIYALVGLALAWVMFGDDNPKPSASNSSSKQKRASSKVEDKSNTNKASGKRLSDEEKRALSARYEIGKKHFESGYYREALEEFQKIASVDPNFNSNLASFISWSKEGLSKLEDQEKKRVAEQNAAEKRIKIKELLATASVYVKDRRAELAQEVFNEIAKLDPENLEVTRLKLELEDWQKEKTKKELEEASNKKAREDRVEKLKPGKTFFLQKEWYKAIGKLEDFLKVKDMDEDLTKEASEMLKTCRDEISSAVSPLSGKAKSLLEGQDLKGAYEVYLQILKIEPSNIEALNQTVEIKENLTNKARKIYREAIISESLSLFPDAKEKFQEVQQISPVDSDYYRKATDKLKDYLE